MPVLSAAALVRLALLAMPMDVAPPACEAGTRHLELTAHTPGEALAVCIHPGLPTNVLFDAKLGRVELPGPVDSGRGSGDANHGDRLRDQLLLPP